MKVESSSLNFKNCRQTKFTRWFLSHEKVEAALHFESDVEYNTSWNSSAKMIASRSYYLITLIRRIHMLQNTSGQVGSK